MTGRSQDVFHQFPFHIPNPERSSFRQIKVQGVIQTLYADRRSGNPFISYGFICRDEASAQGAIACHNIRIRIQRIAILPFHEHITRLGRCLQSDHGPMFHLPCLAGRNCSSLLLLNKHIIFVSFQPRRPVTSTVTSAVIAGSV